MDKRGRRPDKGAFQKLVVVREHLATKVPTVLVQGAGTSIGKNAIQLAIAAGYHVIATASPENWDTMRNLCAFAVFDYRSSSVIDDVVTSLKDRKCAGAVAIGQGSLAKCVDIVKMIPGAAKNVAQVTIDMPESPPTSKFSILAARRIQV
ncbi:hypothetical protein FOZG_17674 [Fusarium oxysporum Fo47]|uniref:Alcohol dehydrogenase-like C-terminal domain-containing protein n=1 Tax=Fusarium oxysporum Fo47 TaxID=660027 RepID=W9JDW7_FUSOX|nr:hypothetical protein FOZG_17674 [Fusarium oxysporum Fo47]